MKISQMFWTFHVATGFPSGSSQDLHLTMGFDNVCYPPQEETKCPDLSPEPCCSSKFVTRSNKIEYWLICLKCFLSKSVPKNSAELQLQFQPILFSTWCRLPSASLYR